MPPTRRTYTRVAVVQLNYQPAAVIQRRSLLEEPLAAFGPADGLLPTDGTVPSELEGRYRALRQRIRETYDDQLLQRLQAILRACQGWGVRLVVFPEYSIPWEILGGVADAAGDMVVVAGTHAVERAARDSGIYQHLGLAAAPAPGMSVCPVLYQQRLLAVQAKLNPAHPEQGSMRPGQAWQAVTLPEGFPGPMGVLICLDFLYRESKRYQQLVAVPLDICRFLAVPSLTPHYTLSEFAGTAWEEARRYRRPVLYADIASGGGTSIYVDEGVPTELRRFPEHAGYLEPGDEGVIVADVDLGYEHTGRSRMYADQPAVVPVAAASLVYGRHPVEAAYAAWLSELSPLLAKDDTDSLDAAIAQTAAARELLLNAGALSGAVMRQRRLQRLLAEAGGITTMEDIRRFTREVSLPPDVLPLADLQAALARAAADVVFDWMRQHRSSGLAAVEARLRAAGKPVEAPDPALWTDTSVQALATVLQGIHEPAEPVVTSQAAAPQVRVVLPEGINPAVLGEGVENGLMFRFLSHPRDLHSKQNVLPEDPQATRTPPRLMEFMVYPHDQRREAETLFLLAQAEGAQRVAAVVISPETSREAAILTVFARNDTWILWTDGRSHWLNEHWQAVVTTLAQRGMERVEIEAIPPDSLEDRLSFLLPRFANAQRTIEEFCAERLHEVEGHFVEPDVLVNDSDMRQPALAALDAWVASTVQTVLVLGEFGCGKSTLLARWALQRWHQGTTPLPILCNLAGAGSSADAIALLLRAAVQEDTPPNRAALTLLIRHGRLLPCFDGFDEMATRVTSAELAGRLAELLQVASAGGRVVLSSRDHYFPSETSLRSATEQALALTLGDSSGVWRLAVQLFTDQQIATLVQDICGTEALATAALQRLASIYPLHELASRPLLLGMVLATLDSIDLQAGVSQADLYEAYLARWLRQTTHDMFSSAQKIELAEALAEQLWRSGAPACTVQDLQQSVRQRLSTYVSEDMPLGAADLETFGGSFFVREGDDHYRFAHKSFLEFFLARSLVRTLSDRPAAMLDTNPLTPEVAAFVGELLRRDGDMLRSRTLQAVQTWLTQGRRSMATDGPGLDATAVPAANALRLLVGLSRWARQVTGWVPTAADLRRVHLVGEDLHEVALIAADLHEADLSGSNLTAANLHQARLTRSRLVGACLDHAVLTEVQAQGADFTLVAVDHAQLEQVDLTGAVLRQSTWTECVWTNAVLAEADMTACILYGTQDLPDIAPDLSLRIPAGRATLMRGHMSWVEAVAWAPDGQRLASGGLDGTVRLWAVQTGQEVARLEGHRDWVRAVAWAPDGQWLASGGGDGTVRLWAVQTGQEVARLEGHRDWVWAVAWAPDGQWLASGGGDGTVRLWAVQTGQEVARLEGHRDWVRAVAWAPNGQWLASGGLDGTVRLWAVQTGQEVARLDGHRGMVEAVTWAPDGQWLASGGGDGTIRLWAAQTGQEVARLAGTTGQVGAVAWAPDGQWLASGGGDGTIRLWAAQTGQEVARLAGYTGRVGAVAWAPDGQRLASGGGDGTIRLWAAQTGQEVARLAGYTGRVGAVAWAPDGQRLASGGGDGTIRLWAAQTGQEVARLAGTTGQVGAVAWAPDGQWLASGGGDGTIRLWVAQTGQEVARLEGHRGRVETVAWAPDGQWLASGGEDGTVRLWVAQTGQEVARLEGHRGMVEAVAWAPDGQRLASGGGDIRLWVAQTGQEVARLEGHRTMAVAWAPDGQRLASGGGDGMVRLWTVQTGQEVARLEGHGGMVEAVAWAPDGHRLASGGLDGTVRLWAVQTGQEVARLEGHRGMVEAVAWAPDGQQLASGGEDGTVRLWDAERGVLLCVLEMLDDSTLASTPHGFCRFGHNTALCRLAVSRPEQPGTVLYVPLGGMSAVLESPDKVRATLAGDLSGDDLQAELDRRGWRGGIVWDGTVQKVPASSTPRPVHRVVDESPRISALHFRPGPALIDADALPGREAVLQELLALIGSRSPAVLRGPRRSGKTSILHTLSRRLAPTHRVRHVTLEGAQVHTANDLACLLAPDLRDMPASAKLLRQRFREEKVAVLLLDEIDYLCAADLDIFAWLRAVGQYEASLVLAGSHQDWVHVIEHAAVAPGSSFGNDATPVTLGPLAPEDAVQFLVETAAADGVPLTAASTAAWIVEVCGPWPFYLQVLGHAVVQAVLAGNRFALVERRGVFDLYEQRLLRDRWAVFQTRWQELPSLARTVLAGAQDGQLPSYRHLSSAERKAMRDSGLCTATGGWLDDRPFFDWIRQNAEDMREDC